MITAGELFSLRSLHAAAARAARGKRRRANVARFVVDLEPELVTLRGELLAGAFKPSRPRLLAVRDPKPRTISVLPFRDRVVHQAVAAVLAPRIERRLIADSYACRPGRGTHAALARGRAWSRTFAFHAHLDVVKYFPAVDHAFVRAQLAQDVRERWLRALAERILEAGAGEAYRAHFPGDELFTPLTRAVGLPLGSLTSQLWANRFLDPIDHLVKDRLRVRAYLRYMDDLLLFGDDRAALVDICHRVEAACWSMRLRLHPWEVRPTRAGVGLVGYRVMPEQVRMRRSTVARAERRLARQLALVERGALDPSRVWEGLRATFAHYAFADTFRLKERMLRRLGVLWEPGAR
jgi:retron-type reverse transcriptase